ncbi:MAG: hypothetical protein Q8L22_20195 [Reyranella sp.]|nr:hypothetical protein [Reyranella sp.]
MPSVKAIACVSLFTFALAAQPILAQDRTSPPLRLPPAATPATPTCRSTIPLRPRPISGAPTGMVSRRKASLTGPSPGGQRPGIDGQRSRPPGDGDSRIGQQNKPPRAQGERRQRDQTATPPTDQPANPG